MFLLLAQTDYFILGAPGVSEGRGALFYSSPTNIDIFTRGNTLQGASDILDQYQGTTVYVRQLLIKRLHSIPLYNHGTV